MRHSEDYHYGRDHTLLSRHHELGDCLLSHDSLRIQYHHHCHVHSQPYEYDSMCTPLHHYYSGPLLSHLPSSGSGSSGLLHQCGIPGILRPVSGLFLLSFHHIHMSFLPSCQKTLPLPLKYIPHQGDSPNYHCRFVLS